MFCRKFSIIIGVMLFSALVFAPAAQAQIGQIKNLTGTVQVLRGSETLVAKIGDLLESADTVYTGSGSSVGITFIDNSRFSLGPNSRVELSKFQFDPTTHDGEFSSSVKRGTVLILSGQIAKHSKEAMKVKTPTSILGVRGTRFLVKVAD